MHANRISQVMTDASGDSSAMDLEVQGFRAIIHQKIRKDSEYPEAWTTTESQLAQLESVAEEADPVELEAARLGVRMRQFEILMSAAVRVGLFDQRPVPVDDWSREP